MEQREADLADMAAGALTFYEFQKILRQDKYERVVQEAANYALERQVHAPSMESLRSVTNRMTQPWFMYRTFDCVRQVTTTASNRVQQGELRPTDWRAATNLLVFVPYLKARGADAAEAQPYVRRDCDTALSWLNRLQQRARN